MKKTILTAAVVSFFTFATAQPVVVNGNFENWVPVENLFGPANWKFDSTEVTNGAVSRSSSTSSGMYSLSLGSYNSGGQMQGAGIESVYYDSLNSVPGSLLFEYMVEDNNTNPLNGLVVEIRFFDAQLNFINDFSWKSPSLTNNSSFVTGDILLSFPVGSVPAFYSMLIRYNNVEGSSTESVLIDNIRFGEEHAAGLKEMPFETATVYPNPANTSFSANGTENASGVKIISAEGKEISLSAGPDGQYNIRNLSNGLYYVVWISEGAVTRRSKLLVQH